MKRLAIIFLFIVTASLNAQIDLEQQLSGYVNPQEQVTISEATSFNQAIQILSRVSEKISGKKIVSTVMIDSPIGIAINKIAYKKALVIIVQYHNLIFEEGESVIVVKKKTEIKADTSSNHASINDREVSISALFFQADTYAMRERGVNWEILLSQSGLSIGPKLTSMQEATSTSTSSSSTTGTTPTLDISTSSTFSSGGFDGSATALFRFFESENLGELFASPSISVKNGVEGRIQVGTDLSIKQKDFSGNLIDKFVSTGTIIKVTPRVFREDDIDFIQLKLDVEKSTGTPGELSTTINKTTASTSVLLLDGEETTIGGLYVNEETKVRRGIPILKDLPWWVLGIRYLTGYDQTINSKKEIIITIKANILPTLKERISRKKEENLIKKQIQKNQELLEKYKLESMQKEKEK
jgi:general secretion pathway protein D